MPSNPLTQSELNDYAIGRILTPSGELNPYMPSGYFLATHYSDDSPALWRLFDASYIRTGIIDPNRLGTGSTGAGSLYLADDGQWKVIGGGGGDMYKATYDTDNSGIVDKAEALMTLGRNSTGATLYKGTVIRIEGSTGNRPNFVKAQGNNDANSAQTFGIISTDITNNSDGYAIVQGTLHDLDTRTGAGGATNPFTDVTLVDGDILYLHPTIPGYITNIKPLAPEHMVYVGVVTRTSPTNGTIVYRIQNGYELYELHDVAPTPYVNNGVLYRDTTTNLWKSATIATLLGGTPLIAVPTLAQVTTAGNTTTNAITVGGLIVDTNTLVVDSVNNRVGIGTTTPTAPLHINGPSTGLVDILKVTKDGGSTSYFGIFSDTSNTSRFDPSFLGYHGSGGNVALQFIGGMDSSLDTSGAGPLVAFEARKGGVSGSIVSTRDLFEWRNYGTSLIRIKANGNVLINTTTDAGYKLDVNGAARIKGTGTTSATTVFTITNSAATYNSLIIRDDGTFVFGNPNNGVSYLTAAANGNISATYYTAGLDISAGRSITSPYYVASGSITASGAIARSMYMSTTLVAAANNDVLVGLDINPTFTNGAFTGITNYLLRAKNNGTLRTQVDQYGRQEWYLNSGTAEIGKIAYSTPGNFPGIIIWTGATYNSNRFNLINNGTYFGLAFDADGAGYGRLNIFNGGVGIGTSTNAGYQLDVNGTVRLKDRLVIDSGSTLDYPITLTTSKTGNNGTVYLANTSSTGQVLMVFHNEVGGNYSYNSYGLLLYGGSGAGDPLFGANRQNRFMIAADGASNLGMYLGTLSAQPLVFGTNNVERIRINSSGSVGIGTTSPSYKLQVVGDIALSGNLVPTAGSQTLGTFTNRFGDVWAGGLIVGTTFYGDNYQTASGTMFFKDGGGVERMRMTSVGNFLIGTTIDPGYKLTVNGDINTSGVFRVGGVAGWTGTINCPTNPPGQQNIQVTGGIITNVF